MKKLIFILILVVISFSTGNAQEPVSEDAVKAAFIYHFIGFTHWQDNQPHYDVCIPDDTELRNTAWQTIEGRSVNGRTINVVNRYDHCHILVSENVPPQEPVFTIGSLANGALLEFRIVDNKLRFAVNMEKLRNLKLKISSQLLKLAILENI